MTPRAAVRPSAAEAERIGAATAALANGVASLTTALRSLDDPSWVVRRVVIELLAGAGEAASDALLDLLEHRRDDENRLAAVVDALVASTAPVDDRVIAMLARKNPAVVVDAAAILGRRRNRRAVPHLRELVRGADDNVAVAAIEALGRLGGRAAVDALVAAVRSGSFFRTFPAIDVLGRTGDPRAIDPLAELLEDPIYTHEAARALGRTGDPAGVAPLLDLLRRPGEALVRAAAVALSDLREGYAALYGSPEAIDLLIRDRASAGTSRRLIAGLRGSSPTEQAAIVRVLGLLGGAEVAETLTAQLDGPEQVARVAADVLRKLGAAGAPSLCAALRDGDSARRRLVLEALQPRSIAAEDVLVALDDPDGIVRARACELLGRIGQVSVVPALFELIADPNARVAHAALGAIQALGGEIASHLSLVAARSDDPRVRRQAFRLLGYFGDPAAVDPLVAAIDDPDTQLAELALQSLGNVDDPRAVAAVLHAVGHREPRVRAAAMRALAQVSSDEASPCLLRALEDEDAWNRYYACQSLGRRRDEQAVAAIARRLADPAGQVRVAAIEALSQLQSPVAAAHLIEAARSSDQDVRRACLMGMAIAKREESLPLVLEATRADESATRLVACSALTSFAADEVSVRLGELAHGDVDEAVRLAALSALSERPGPTAVRAIASLLDHAMLRDRVRDLLALPVKGRVEGILTALDDCDDELAGALTSALARMRKPEALTALAKAMAHPNPAARRAAAITAAALGNRSLVDVLRSRLTTDPDAEVRRVIASALRT